MASLNSTDMIAVEVERISRPEHIAGKCLNQPNTMAISGSRKILFSTQFDQKLPLINPEPPLIQTGYENQFGEYSSSFKVAKDEYQILKKIYKFSFVNDHYFLITRNTRTGEIGVIERKSYVHNTESYGYINDCRYIDSLEEGSGIIPIGTVYQKSTSFDDNNNRQDGVNLLTLYLATDKTKEDGIIISESAAKKLTSPFFHKVTIMINDNEIPINLYGNDQIYKFIPDIGERAKDGLLCAIRKENKDESLYNQSSHMLKQILMSDTKYTVSGQVVDINISCNNPENLNSVYMGQLKMYYEEDRRFASELTRFVSGYANSGYILSYDLQKLFNKCNNILMGKQYIKDGKLFSNIIVEITLMAEHNMGVGDKLTDRYGGKGVVSQIRPDHLMPILDNGKTVEIIYDQYTPVNRGNPPQLTEISLNFISDRLLEFIDTKTFDASEFVSMYIEYVTELSPTLGEYLEKFMESMTDEDMMLYLSDMVRDGICLSLEPISEAVNLDKLEKIYDKFPFIKPYTVQVPIVGSNGEVRYSNALRNVVAGKKYIYRLKQYAKDKFSVTSLSSTNIRGENCRSRNNKDYQASYSRTPIMLGGMETGNLGHMGMATVITNLMIYSVSPTARRMCEQMLIKDPFDINIKLDSESSNRSVEILNAYMKSLGFRLEFIKRPKGSSHPLLTVPITKFAIPENPINMVSPIKIVNPNEQAIKYVDCKVVNQSYAERQEYIRQGYKFPVMVNPIQMHPVTDEI